MLATFPTIRSPWPKRSSKPPAWPLPPALILGKAPKASCVSLTPTRWKISIQPSIGLLIFSGNGVGTDQGKLKAKNDRPGALIRTGISPLHKRSRPTAAWPAEALSHHTWQSAALLTRPSTADRLPQHKKPPS